MLARALPIAVDRAVEYLLAQADRDFAETRHVMVFPHAAGFTGAAEQQSSDVFARTVLAGVLLDIADLDADNGARARILRDLAGREAQHVARAKLNDRAGGWSYFPGLPELPPDADSLAAALRLFARVDRALTALCQLPIDIVLDDVRPDGSLDTWIIAPSDGPVHRQLMERGIRDYWGRGADPEVCAHFYLALLELDRVRYTDAALAGARYILSRQDPDGSWAATWYWGAAYGIGLCLGLLRALGVAGDAVARGVDFLSRSQRDDGGWGPTRSLSLETGLALWALGPLALAECRTSVEQATSFLLKRQTADGSWIPSPWIKMDIGRATGSVIRTATYQSITMTTTFCLRSLLLARAALG